MGRTVVTENDLSPAIQISVWLCLVVIALTIVIRYAIKFWIIRHFNLDDHLTCLAAVSAVAQSMIISIAATNGLGQRSENLESPQRTAMLKLQYAAQVLFVTSMTFSKLGLLVFLRNLSRTARNRRLCHVLGIIISLWALTSIFAIVFECRLPDPWQIIDGQCLSLVAIYVYVATLNIATDVVLTVQPIFIIRNLNVALRKRLIIGGAFAARSLVTLLLLIQVVYTKDALTSGDPTFNIWRAAILGQLAQALSIVTASTMYLKPFIDSLQSGFLQAGDLRRRHDPGFRSSAEDRTRGSSPSSKRRFRWTSKRNYPDNTSQYSEIELQRPHAVHGKNVGYSATATQAGPPTGPTEGSQLHIMQATTFTVEEG